MKFIRITKNTRVYLKNNEKDTIRETIISVPWGTIIISTTISIALTTAYFLLGG